MGRPRTPGGLLDAFDARLPFTLTRGQVEVSETIMTELAQPRPGTTPISVPHIPVTRGAPAVTAADRVPTQGSTARPVLKENSLEL